ncbi:Zn-dependent hydrolase [Methylobacterium planeticum]|uniref:Zn-dependent hydrolase n=1 Tax=Methylobacterium planeticum TaxID=2615211 RepID=A0A6N6MDS9_9HYPH|nr:Zn-dependent hydrolase [Methylobacterium planeticum]KAB1068913.1 Zn-dependent hydrolase [Methylobacterium planeticum]
MTSTSSRPDPGLHDLFARFSACGATQTGGVHRLCGSAADGLARDLFAATVAETGGTLRTDAVGNQFGLFSLAGRSDAPRVMLGSHLDSQPQGGRFDGTLGVATALRVGAALVGAKARGRAYDADLCVVNWTNEEGARFRPGLLGSGTYAGHHRAEDALASQDDAGVTLERALAAIGHRGTDTAPPLPACYLELHVEQGSVLTGGGATIGIVMRNWGATKIDAVFTGAQAHTGPCPMPLRRDALLAAAYAIAEVRAIADRWPGQVHTSVGRIRVEPNSANVVPSRVEISVEIRSGADPILAEAGALADGALKAAAGRARTNLSVLGRVERPVRALPGAVADLLALAAEETGYRAMPMDTVAGHDALSLLGACPTGLVFVPSIGGIAHDVAEETSDADMQAGLAVMLRSADRLCRAGGSPERAIREAAR